MRMYWCRAGTISCSQICADDCRARAASRVGIAALSYHRILRLDLPRTPCRLSRMLLRLVGEFRRAMDLSLVLDAEGIPHELREEAGERWVLVVDDADA